MLITLIIITIALYLYILHTIRSHKRQRAEQYAKQQETLDKWREEAIATGTIFTKYDRKAVEQIIKAQEPIKNRKQRKAQSKQYGKEFERRARMGLE